MRGIGSEPATRRAWTSRYGCALMGPEASVTRSSVRSWNAMSIPSEVARASVSRYAYPSSTACSNAVHEFSGACVAPPRWAKAMGRGWSRNGTRTTLVCPRPGPFR